MKKLLIVVVLLFAISFLFADLANAVMTVSDAEMEVGETFTINVSTNELLEEWNVTAFQFRLSFDGDLMEYSNYSIEGLITDGNESYDAMLAVNANVDNEITVAYAGCIPVAGMGDIVILEFVALAEGVSNLSLLSEEYPFFFNTTEITNLNDGIVNIGPVSANDNDIQNVTKLQGNYPNPFKENTTISFSLSEDVANGTIEIFNLKGQLVKEFSVNNNKTEVTWDASNQASGIYFYKMKADGKYTSVKKMILLK